MRPQARPTMQNTMKQRKTCSGSHLSIPSQRISSLISSPDVPQKPSKRQRRCPKGGALRAGAREKLPELKRCTWAASCQRKTQCWWHPHVCKKRMEKQVHAQIWTLWTDMSGYPDCLSKISPALQLQEPLPAPAAAPTSACLRSSSLAALAPRNAPPAPGPAPMMRGIPVGTAASWVQAPMLGEFPCLPPKSWWLNLHLAWVIDNHFVFWGFYSLSWLYHQTMCVFFWLVLSPSNMPSTLR